MKNYEWKSSLSEYLRRYIAFKKASGLKFARQEALLQFFDRFHFYGGYHAGNGQRIHIRQGRKSEQLARQRGLVARLRNVYAEFGLSRAYPGSDDAGIPERICSSLKLRRSEN